MIPGHSDTERIDFLEQNPEYRLVKHRKQWMCCPFSNYEFNTYPTARAAIDAAIDDTWQDE